MRVFRVESSLGTEELHRSLEELDAVAVRPGMAESLEELELAFHLARSAFDKKKNIARKLRYEFLLWLSGTRDISSAMKRTAPDGKEFLLIVFSGSKPPAGFKLKETGLGRHGDPLRLERISLSRIRS